MATTVDGKIMEALFARLSALTLNPAMPIAWPNMTFNPPATNKFLRVQFIPNMNSRVFIGSTEPHQRMGLLQVGVCWPKNDGETKPRDVAGLIAAHFPTDLILAGDVEVRITEAPSVADLMVEDTRVMIPVTIPYECWA